MFRNHFGLHHHYQRKVKSKQNSAGSFFDQDEKHDFSNSDTDNFENALSDYLTDDSQIY